MSFLNNILPALIGVGTSLFGGAMGGRRISPQEAGLLSQEQIQEALRNQLIQLFTPIFQQMRGQIDPVLQQYMDLGSPFYQQKQRQVFEQGVGQAQNRAAMAREQLGARGLGYGPSGAGAAMFGGMGQAEAGNQAENFLNQLFQNEQLQLQATGMKQQEMGAFNPTQLFKGIPRGASGTQESTLGQGISQAGSILASLFRPQPQPGPVPDISNLPLPRPPTGPPLTPPLTPAPPPGTPPFFPTPGF